MGWVKSSVFFVGKSIFLAQFCRDEKPRAFEARGFVQKYLLNVPQPAYPDTLSTHRATVKYQQRRSVRHFPATGCGSYPMF